MLVYVDDIVLFSNLQSAMEEIVCKFFTYFKTRTPNNVEKFLGLTVEDNGAEIKLHN